MYIHIYIYIGLLLYVIHLYTTSITYMHSKQLVASPGEDIITLIRIYVYVYMYICLYICLYMYTYVYIYKRTYTYTC